MTKTRSTISETIIGKDEPLQPFRSAMIRDTEYVVEAVAIECHHASCANVPRHNPDYDRSAYPWEHCPTPAKDAWRAIARAALEATDRQSLSDRIDELTRAVDQYRNAPYRSADWLANEIMTILDVVANDPHPRAALHQEDKSNG